MKTIAERMDLLESRLRDQNFRSSKGLSGEVSYYVFDYDPKEELYVRQRVQDLKNTDTEYKFGYKLAVFDLYELMLQLLQDEGVLEDLENLEEEEGTEYVFTTIADVLRFEEDDNQIIQYIVDHTPKEPDTIVFLTGVGKCYPILRSHKILNNLHQAFVRCPVVGDGPLSGHFVFPGTVYRQCVEYFWGNQGRRQFQLLPGIPHCRKVKDDHDENPGDVFKTH